MPLAPLDFFRSINFTFTILRFLKILQIHVLQIHVLQIHLLQIHVLQIQSMF